MPSKSGKNKNMLILKRNKESLRTLGYSWGYIIFDDPPSSVFTAKSLVESSVGKKDYIIITVGDIVSYNFMRYFKSNLMIIDLKNKREEELLFSNHLEINVNTIHCKNNPGTISLNCINVIKDILSKLKPDDKTVIYVEGEEDLLSLVCLALCKDQNMFIVYGNWKGFLELFPCNIIFKKTALNLLKKYFILSFS